MESILQISYPLSCMLEKNCISFFVGHFGFLDNEASFASWLPKSLNKGRQSDISNLIALIPFHY